jgi:hypothetical protein
MYSEVRGEAGLRAEPPATGARLSQPWSNRCWGMKRCDNKFLRILAIQKIAHSFSSGCVLFAALGFIRAVTGCIGRFGAAFRTVIRKARLARLQLKFFRADSTYFDRKFHNHPSILSEVSFHTHQSPAARDESSPARREASAGKGNRERRIPSGMPENRTIFLRNYE